MGQSQISNYKISLVVILSICDYLTYNSCVQIEFYSHLVSADTFTANNPHVFPLLTHSSPGFHINCNELFHSTLCVQEEKERKSVLMFTCGSHCATMKPALVLSHLDGCKWKKEKALSSRTVSSVISLLACHPPLRNPLHFQELVTLSGWFSYVKLEGAIRNCTPPCNDTLIQQK